jgi:hypothetical protein
MIGWVKPKEQNSDSTPDRHYIDIIENRSLSASFFKDSEPEQSSITPDMHAGKDSDDEVNSNTSYEVD